MRRALLISFLLAIALIATAGGRFQYVYARGDGATTITHGSLEDLLKIHKRYSGEYLWARVDGREYVIRAAAVLAEVRRAARPMEELDPDYRALHDRMKPLERKQDRLERQIDAFEDRDAEVPADLESQLEQVERELEKYEREEARLDRRQDALDKVFDTAMERVVERAIRAGVAERVR